MKKAPQSNREMYDLLNQAQASLDRLRDAFRLRGDLVAAVLDLDLAVTDLGDAVDAIEACVVRSTGKGATQP